MTISRMLFPDFDRAPHEVSARSTVGAADDSVAAGGAFVPELPIKTYLIAYSMDEETDGERDLGTLYSVLQSLDACARLFRSVWVVQTGLSSGELMQEVSPLLGDNDKLLVVECGPGAEWRGLQLDVSVWLQDLLAAGRSPQETPA